MHRIFRNGTDEERKEKNMPQQQNNFEKVELKSDVGFEIRFVTMQHNSPYHWHRELEILYILNGHATVNMDGKRYELEPLDAIVIDYSKIHEVLYALPQTMGICIHVSKNLLYRFLPSQEVMTFRCARKRLKEEQVEAYERIRTALKEITILYVNQQKTYQLRSNSIILEILADLIDYFSEPISPVTSYTRLSNIERLEQVCDYVEHHHMEEITLQDAADELGLNREYFCRFFAKNMGVSFIKYVNEVRVNHIYQDILHTEDSIQEITERHGFFNQKLFYRTFKEHYGCTPREARNMAKDTPNVPR